jgi:hypothetical protein
MKMDLIIIARLSFMESRLLRRTRIFRLASDEEHSTIVD